MKYIALLSVVSSATAAVINIPLTGNTPAPIKLNENQIVNIRASADLSPDNLKSPSIIIEVTEKDDNSPIEAKSKGITGAAKIDIVDDSFDEEERQIEIIPVDQLSPDGNSTVSRSLLDKLISFLFGDDSGDGMIPDGFSLSIGLGGKKRKARPGEIVDEGKKNQKDSKDSKDSKGSNDDSDSTSNQAGRPHGARPKAQEPETGVKDTVEVPAPAPAPEVPAPPPPPSPAPAPEKKESDKESKPVPKEAPKDETNKPAPKEAPKNETKPDDDGDDGDDGDDDNDDDDDEDEEEDEEIGQFDHVEEQIVRAQVL